MNTRPSRVRFTGLVLVLAVKENTTVRKASLRWSATGDERTSQPPASSMESVERMEWRMLRWVRRGNATIKKGEEEYSEA